MKKERIRRGLQVLWREAEASKRKFSLGRRPVPESPEVCWICRKRGHFKDECPFIRCMFCKTLGHSIGECPLAPARKGTFVKQAPQPKITIKRKVSEQTEKEVDRQEETQ